MQRKILHNESSCFDKKGQKIAGILCALCSALFLLVGGILLVGGQKANAMTRSNNVEICQSADGCDSSTAVDLVNGGLTCGESSTVLGLSNNVEICQGDGSLHNLSNDVESCQNVDVVSNSVESCQNCANVTNLSGVCDYCGTDLSVSSRDSSRACGSSGVGGSARVDASASFLAGGGEIGDALYGGEIGGQVATPTSTAGSLSQVCVDLVDGSDSNDGTETSPVKTIEKAMELVKYGGEIYFYRIVLSGVDSALTIDCGIKNVNLRIGSWISMNINSSRLEIKNTSLKISVVSLGYIINSNMVFENVTFIDLPYEEDNDYGCFFNLSGDSSVTLKNCKFNFSETKTCDQALVYSTATAGEINLIGCEFTNCKFIKPFIAETGGTSVNIDNCKFAGCRFEKTFIEANDATVPISLTNTTFDATTFVKGVVHSNSDCTVDNCQFVNGCELHPYENNATPRILTYFYIGANTLTITNSKFVGVFLDHCLAYYGSNIIMYNCMFDQITQYGWFIYQANNAEIKNTIFSNFNETHNYGVITSKKIDINDCKFVDSNFFTLLFLLNGNDQLSITDTVFDNTSFGNRFIGFSENLSYTGDIENCDFINTTFGGNVFDATTCNNLNLTIDGCKVEGGTFAGAFVKAKKGNVSITNSQFTGGTYKGGLVHINTDGATTDNNLTIDFCSFKNLTVQDNQFVIFWGGNVKLNNLDFVSVTSSVDMFYTIISELFVNNLSSIDVVCNYRNFLYIVGSKIYVNNVLIDNTRVSVFFFSNYLKEGLTYSFFDINNVWVKNSILDGLIDTWHTYRGWFNNITAIKCKVNGSFIATHHGSEFYLNNIQFGGFVDSNGNGKLDDGEEDLGNTLPNNQSCFFRSAYRDNAGNQNIYVNGGVFSCNKGGTMYYLVCPVNLVINGGYYYNNSYNMLESNFYVSGASVIYKYMNFSSIISVQQVNINSTDYTISSYNTHNVTIDGAVFEDNSNVNGGGCIAFGAGELNITNCTFRGNHAPAGGVIYNNVIDSSDTRNAKINISRTTFDGNYTEDYTGTGRYKAWADCGYAISKDICASGGVILTSEYLNIDSCVFTNCKIDAKVRDTYLSSVGAIIAHGNTLYRELYLTNSTIQDCNVGGGNYIIAPINGYAKWVNYGGMIDNCIFRNISYIKSYGAGNSSGIEASAMGLLISNCLFEGFESYYALIVNSCNISNCTFKNNVISGSFLVCFAGYSPRLSGCKFIDNYSKYTLITTSYSSPTYICDLSFIGNAIGYSNTSIENRSYRCLIYSEYISDKHYSYLYGNYTIENNVFGGEWDEETKAPKKDSSGKLVGIGEAYLFSSICSFKIFLPFAVNKPVRIEYDKTISDKIADYPIVENWVNTNSIVDMFEFDQEGYYLEGIADKVYVRAVGSKTIDYSASDYIGEYDGQSHGITINAPSGATIEYSLDNTNFSSEPITRAFTNGEDVTVYFKISYDGKTVSDSRILNIKKAKVYISNKYIKDKNSRANGGFGSIIKNIPFSINIAGGTDLTEYVDKNMFVDAKGNVVQGKLVSNGDVAPILDSNGLFDGIYCAFIPKNRDCFEEETVKYFYISTPEHDVLYYYSSDNTIANGKFYFNKYDATSSDTSLNSQNPYYPASQVPLSRAVEFVKDNGKIVFLSQYSMISGMNETIKTDRNITFEWENYGDNAIQVDSGAKLTIGTFDMLGKIIFDGKNQENNSSLIYNNGGTLNINGSVVFRKFVKKTTSTSGGSVIASGSALNINLATFESSVFDRNSVTVGGGSIFIGGGTARLNNCRFINNTSSGLGGAIFSSSGTVLIDHCYFSGNKISTTAGQGKGFAIATTGGSVTISNSIISGSNVSTTAGYVGGAVYVGASGNLTASNCEIVGYGAYQGGGFYSEGTLRILGCQIKNCKANSGGSAIYFASGKLVVSGTKIYGCTTTNAGTDGTESGGIFSKTGNVPILMSLSMENNFDGIVPSVGQFETLTTTTGKSLVALYVVVSLVAFVAVGLLARGVVALSKKYASKRKK